MSMKEQILELVRSHDYVSFAELDRFAPASVLTYVIDGAVPKHPVAKQARAYKTPRWAPVVLRPSRNSEADNGL